MDFILRPWNLNDLTALIEYANNYKIARFLTNGFPHPYTIENGQKFISIATQNSPPTLLAIEIEGKASGSIGLHTQEDIHSRNMELGYWLAEPYWGQGIMTHAVKQMVAYGFSQFDVERIFARPFGSNIASQKVLENAGFVLEARFKSTLYKYNDYIDELVYAVRKNNPIKTQITQ